MRLWTAFPISRAKSCYHEDEICSLTSEVISSVLCHSEQRCSQAEVRQKSHLHLRLIFPNISFHKNLLFCIFYKIKVVLTSSPSEFPQLWTDSSRNSLLWQGSGTRLLPWCAPSAALGCCFAWGSWWWPPAPSLLCSWEWGVWQGEMFPWMDTWASGSRETDRTKAETVLLTILFCDGLCSPWFLQTGGPRTLRCVLCGAFQGCLGWQEAESKSTRCRRVTLALTDQP